MKISARPGMFVAVTAAFAGLMPSLVHACPMCFAGGNQNQDAFLYGSLFLMIVPSATLGGLGYWVYRRIKAIDEGLVEPDLDEATVDAQSQNSGNAVVLPMPSRR